MHNDQEGVGLRQDAVQTAAQALGGERREALIADYQVGPLQDS